MKIIELLNKIANGEEVPKKIKFDNKEYENEPCYMLYEATGERNELQFKKFLNEEVEIIEEKKIPEKLPIGLKQTKDGIFNTIVKDDIQYELNEKEEIICKKIHEIIDYLKSKGDE